MIEIEKDFDSYLQTYLKLGKFKEFVMLGTAKKVPEPAESVHIGDVGNILNAIYRHYSTDPEFKINLLLEDTLIKMLNSGDFYEFYAAMDIIMNLTRDGRIAISDEMVYKALKEAISENYDFIKDKKSTFGARLCGIV